MGALRKEDLNKLSGSHSYADYILAARRRFEDGQAATVAELRQVYRRAAAAIRKDIEAVTPGTLRAAHLTALAKNLETRAKELNTRVLGLARQGIYVSTAAGTSAAEGIAESTLAEAFEVPAVKRLFAGINERATLALLSRTGKDGLKLSDRVWRISERYRNAAKRVIEDGVARGLDARKLGREVQKYLEPGVWTAQKLETRQRLGVPKDVSYEGMRLARTEMNNAFHEGAIAANRETPSYRGIFWRLSNAHPFPDICDDYAQHNGNGFWPKGQEPARPHPNCECVVAPAHEDPKAFTERLRAWMADPASQPDLEQWYNGTAWTVLKRPSRGSLIPKSVPGTPTGAEPMWAALAALDVPSPIAAVSEALGAELQRLTKAEAVEFAGTVDSGTGAHLGSILRGGSDYCDISPHLRAMQPGHRYIQLHTHPRSSAFSDADVAILANHPGVEVMGVIGLDGTAYSMSRIEGAAVATKPEIRRAFENAVWALRPKYQEKIRTGEMTEQEAWKEHSHEVWTRIAERLGFRYVRVPPGRVGEMDDPKKAKPTSDPTSNTGKESPDRDQPGFLDDSLDAHPPYDVTPPPKVVPISKGRELRNARRK